MSKKAKQNRKQGCQQQVAVNNNQQFLWIIVLTHMRHSQVSESDTLLDFALLLDVYINIIQFPERSFETETHTISEFLNSYLP